MGVTDRYGDWSAMRWRWMCCLVTGLFLVLGGCADDDAAVDPDAESSRFAPDPDITGPAAALCAAYDDIDEPHGVENVLAHLTPDATVRDAMTGDEHHGSEAVAGYVAALRDTTGITGAACGDMVQAGRWVAGTTVLSGPGGPVRQGIWAVRVVDDKVDLQIDHYTSVSGDVLPPLDPDTGDQSVGHRYCTAWSGPDIDADAVLAMMVESPTVYAARTFDGADAVRGFIDVLPYEILDCGPDVHNGQWQALPNTFAAPGQPERQMVSVFNLDSDLLVMQHWFHYDPPAPP